MADNPTNAPSNSRRRNTIIAILILIIIAILLLLFSCPAKKRPAPTPKTATQPTTSATPAHPTPTTPPPSTPSPIEKLDPATITAPAQAPAGSTISLSWSGPDNPGDFITIAAKDAAANQHHNYRETKYGPKLELIAPTAAGPYELRYITSKTHTILGRAAIELTPVTATLEAPAEVTLGSDFQVSWTGPNNKGDYITIVEPSAGASDYKSYADTEKGKTLKLTAHTTPGDYEVRYIAAPSGQTKVVLARRAIKVIAAAVTLTAPDTAVAGSSIEVSWTGPNNRGDYITIVPTTNAPSAYGHYFDCDKPSPHSLLTPATPGAVEIRYNTSDHKILARRPITLTAAAVTLSAPPEAKFDTDIPITWTGPNFSGDYITICPKSTPDGQYGAYTMTSEGSPLSVKVPKAEGGEGGTDYEVRYMTGQGDKVLARALIKITS